MVERSAESLEGPLRGAIFKKKLRIKQGCFNFSNWLFIRFVGHEAIGSEEFADVPRVYHTPFSGNLRKERPGASPLTDFQKLVKTA
jgi:hypothetical protein